MPINPALGRLGQKDHRLEARVGYPVKPCLKNTKIKVVVKYYEQPLKVED
jgi:hypothetical protein